MTKIVNAKDGVEEGARIIRNGGLVVFPTETVYGLGANAFDEKAVESIFKAKGRPQDNPLIVHISSLQQVDDVAVDVPDAFYRLAERFMPGPLTVILKKNEKIPYVVTAWRRYGGRSYARQRLRKATYCGKFSHCRSV